MEIAPAGSSMYVVCSVRINARYLRIEVISDHQRSSEVIRGHQRPSEVIRGHQ